MSESVYIQIAVIGDDGCGNAYRLEPDIFCNSDIGGITGELARIQPEKLAAIKSACEMMVKAIDGVPAHLQKPKPAPMPTDVMRDIARAAGFDDETVEREMLFVAKAVGLDDETSGSEL